MYEVYMTCSANGEEAFHLSFPVMTQPVLWAAVDALQAQYNIENPNIPIDHVIVEMNQPAITLTHP